MDKNNTFSGIGGIFLILLAFLIANPAIAIGIIVSIFVICLICSTVWKLLTKPRKNISQDSTGSYVNLFESGIKSLQENKPEKAVSYFSNYLTLAKTNIGECYFYRGLAYIRMRKNNEAIPDLKKAQELLKYTNKEIYNNCTFLLSKISTPLTKDIEPKIINKVNKKVTTDDIKNKVENKKIINLQNCSKKDILTLMGFDEKKANDFILKRKNGLMWYNIDSFVQEFEIQPHEMILIQDRLVFPPKPSSKMGKRKIDI